MKISPLMMAWITTSLLVLAYFTLVGTSGLGIMPWLDEAITMQEMTGTWLQKEALPTVSGLTTIGQIPANERPIVDAQTLMQHIYAYDVHPPTYYLLAVSWSHLFGLGIPQLRALSVLMAALAAVFALATIARTTPTKPATALALALASFVLITSPSLLFAAGNARNYATALLFIAVAFWAMGRLWTTARMHTYWFAMAGMAAGLAFFTHYFSILALGPAMLACAAHHWRHPRAVLAGVLAFGIPTWLTLPYLARHLHARPEQYQGFGEPIQEIIAAISSVAAPFISFHQASVVRTGFGLFCVGAIVVTAFWVRRRAPAITPALSALLCYPIFLFVLFAVSDKTLQQAAYSPRYAVPILVPALLLLVTTLAHTIGQWPRAAYTAMAPIFIATMAFLWGGMVPTAARLSPWAHHNQLAPLAALMAKYPKQSLIILPAWASNEGPVLLPFFAPDVPIFVATTLDDYEHALTLATTKQYVTILGLYRWTQPKSASTQAHDRLIASGIFSQPDPTTWILTRNAP